MRERLTLDGFIAQSISVHKNKYDYSKTTIGTWKTKVCIICPEHGKFWKSPNNHIRQKQGCPICSNIMRTKNQTMTQDEFLKRAKTVHPNYLYEKAIYIKSYEKVCVTCPIHGDFWQEANSHLMGSGCPKCYLEKSSKEKLTSQDVFIKRAKSIYGNRFVYDKTKYIGIHEKICVTCRQHGDFYVRANDFLNDVNCKECSKIKCSRQRRKKKDTFIVESLNKHGNLYDYSKVKYINQNTKVEIICPTHGSFFQKPKEHLNGCGCPMCKRSLGETKVSIFLDKYKIKYIKQYSITNESLFCSNKNIVVDFYVIQYNLFIEYNGEQHYKPINAFGGEESFYKQQERDMALRQYCKEHNINLLEISYKEYNNIDDILKRKLKIK